jgi:hypothetical protein
MAGITQQTKRVSDQSGNGLNDNKCQVERYRYYIYCRKLLDVVSVMVVMVTVMVVMFV